MDYIHVRGVAAIKELSDAGCSSIPCSQLSDNDRIINTYSAGSDLNNAHLFPYSTRLEWLIRRGAILDEP